MNYKELMSSLDKDKLPRHIAVIMDGNGRWAKKNHTMRLNGHRKGVKAVREIVEVAGEMQIDYLTIYAFSTENWNRSTGEVSGLLKLIMNSLINEIEDLNKNNVNIRFIGSTEKLSGEYISKVNENCRKTWNNTGLHLNVAMNYGGRVEILEGIKKMYDDIVEGKITKNDITENLFSQYLYTANMPDPDLLIRTSGEYRLSNFLIWQNAYSEFWFTETLWPDFSKAEFVEAVLDYQKRKRRFGGRNE